ncbi:hypothetical protein D3Y55_15905 [Mesorhizobium sp. DCY119]|nr:hypothetical protein D3Y55_15905 [Mesorhizobium sp. DCY119]
MARAVEPDQEPMERFMNQHVSRRSVVAASASAAMALPLSAAATSYALAETAADQEWEKVERDSALGMSASGRKPAAAVDPVFEAIRVYRKSRANWFRLCEAKWKAEAAHWDIHGRRPLALVAWDHYSAIGASEVDAYRDRLLASGRRNPTQVEAEYAATVEKLAVKRREIDEWDKKTGMTPVYRRNRRALREMRADAERMAATIPTTPAGAAALIKIAVADIKEGEGPAWPWRAVITATRALKRMTVQLPADSEGSGLVSKKLIDLISKHREAYQTYMAVVHLDDSAELGRDPTPRETRICGKASAAEERSLNRLCSYVCKDTAEVRAKARYMKECLDIHTLSDDQMEIALKAAGETWL